MTRGRNVAQLRLVHARHHEGELLCSEAERRVRVVQYTPPLYTVHISCRSSVSETCTVHMKYAGAYTCIEAHGYYFLLYCDRRSGRSLG